MPRPKPSDNGNSEVVEASVRRRRGYRLVAALLIVGLAPTVLSAMGQIPLLLRLIHPELAGAVTFECGTLHWWSTVRLSDVVVKDLATDTSADSPAIPLFTADAVMARQPLWQLAMSAGRDIDIAVDQPTLNVRVHEGTSNLEQVLRKLFPGDDLSDESVARTLTVTVSHGTVCLLPDGLTSTVPTTVTGINGHFSSGHSTTGLPSVAVTAFLGESAAGTTARQTDSNANGVNPRIAATLDDLAGDFPLQPFSARQLKTLDSKTSRPAFSLQLGAMDGSGDRRQLVIEARRINLAELTPIIRRFLPGAICRGECSCRVQAKILGPSVGYGIAGRIQFLGEGVQWSQKSWAAGEMLDFDTITARGAVAVAADGILLQGLRLRSNIVDFDGDGEVKLFPPEAAAAVRARTQKQTDERQRVVSEATAASAGQVRLNGRVDLAAICTMIPRTLNVSDDVVVDSGSVRFSCRVQRASPTESKTFHVEKPPTDFQWQLVAETSPIRAVNAKRPITVNSPIRVAVEGLVRPDSMEMRRATVEGNFGSITADPIDGGLAIRGTVSPSRLWQDFRQLIDLPQPRIAGDVNLKADVRRDGEAVLLQNVLLKSSEVVVKSERLIVDPSRSSLQMLDGSLTVEGTTAAIKTMISPWCQMSWLSGNSTLVASLNAQPDQRLTLEAVVHRSDRTGMLNQTPGFVVHEGRIDASIIADQKTGAFVVERGRIELPGLRSDIAGTLAVRHGLLTVNLSADTAYDLEVLSGQLFAEPNSAIRLSGQGQDKFRLRGTPALLTEADVARFLTRHVGTSATAAPSITPLSASGRIAWQGGLVYGLPLGPGTATVELKRGHLRTEPIHCNLGSGQIDVMPQWDVAGHRIQLASGSRIQNVQVTTELCKEWLGYVAPMMADATNVQGLFSARVHQFDYFIDQPEQTMVQAVLTVHNATASAGTSLDPLFQVVSLLGKQNSLGSRTIDIPAQDIPFEMRDGMVIHDGLQIGVAGYFMTSRGGVGFNRELRLALDIPLERGASGRNNSVRLPFSGTIDRPQLDTHGLLQNLGKQQIDSRVQEQLDRGLNSLLNKLR
ncbi:MAG TPA: hypothetical protein EYG03_05535 [Planctomycetes bacterium]|nr:hypothetical protein [Fuerstiella sp.]HIK91434.1 hypothetical protein [Planctomycetota bacterium]